MPSSNNLAILRTKLANQRTYMAFVRTGAVIAAAAGSFKSPKIILIAILLIIASTWQYFLVNKNVVQEEMVISDFVDYLPYGFVFFSTLVLWFNYSKL
jgi:uncharacterized membrane protein YidH (DUF202 family)